MNASGWIQLFIYIAVLLAVTKPIGLYLHAVLNADGKTCLDPVIKPFERFTYWVGGIDPKKEQDWRRYAGSLLIFSVHYDALHLWHPAPAGQAPAPGALESAENGRLLPRPCLQYRGQLPDQYQLAVLWR